MSFRYRFKQVLKIKNDERERAEQRVAEAMQIERNEQVQLDSLVNLEENTRNELNKTIRNQSMNANDLMNIQRYLDRLKQQVFFQKRKVASAHNQTEMRRNELKMAMQQEDMWEKHRDKKKEQYDFEQDRIEQAVLDELAQAMRERQRIAEENQLNDGNEAR